MRAIRVSAVAGLLAAAVAACGTATPSGSTSTNSAALPAASGTGKAGPTTLDPCQIVTQQDASALTGVSYGTGKQLQGALSRSCLYGAGSKNVFRIDVVSATIDQVHSYRDQATAEIESGGEDGGHFTKNSVPGLGDEATAYTLTGSVLNVSSLFVVKGTVAIYLLNEAAGSTVPTTALTTQARTALGRLP